MNAPIKLNNELPDIQASADKREVAISRAGVEELKLRAHVHDVDGMSQHTIIDATASVAVPATSKGAHMSRLVEALLNDTTPLSIALLSSRTKKMLVDSNSTAGQLSIKFPWFIEKAAPVSGIVAETDVHARYTVEAHDDGSVDRYQTVSMPVTTLCPCSREISEYGAHNQRATVEVQLLVKDWLPIKDIAQTIDSAGSCEIYPLLKRSDERYVTQRAYENAKFVEDVARDLYLALKGCDPIVRSLVKVTSHESIHNHDAFAEISG